MRTGTSKVTMHGIDLPPMPGKSGERCTDQDAEKVAQKQGLLPKYVSIFKDQRNCKRYQGPALEIAEGAVTAGDDSNDKSDLHTCTCKR